MKIEHEINMWQKNIFISSLTRIRVELLMEFRRYSANAKYLDP